MEGERGKLRQSLEELQRLHSQVSILSPVKGMCTVPGLSWDLCEFLSPASLWEAALLWQIPRGQ